MALASAELGDFLVAACPSSNELQFHNALSLSYFVDNRRPDFNLSAEHHRAPTAAIARREVRPGFNALLRETLAEARLPAPGGRLRRTGRLT